MHQMQVFWKLPQTLFFFCQNPVFHRNLEYKSFWATLIKTRTFSSVEYVCVSLQNPCTKMKPSQWSLSFSGQSLRGFYVLLFIKVFSSTRQGWPSDLVNESLTPAKQNWPISWIWLNHDVTHKGRLVSDKEGCESLEGKTVSALIFHELQLWETLLKLAVVRAGPCLPEEAAELSDVLTPRHWTKSRQVHGLLSFPGRALLYFLKDSHVQKHCSQAISVCVRYSLLLSFEEVLEPEVPKLSMVCCGLHPSFERFEETALGSKVEHLATEAPRFRRASTALACTWNST